MNSWNNKFHVKIEWTNEATKFGMHNEILHYDLSKDNIMLHFPPNKLDVMYIGVCVWGEIRYLQ
jgi:hypothetical protein